MHNKLQKAINLSRKTGDRLIVFDSPRSADPFVVMSLDDYEKMVLNRSEVRGLTEDELLDKINRDIAIWKSEQNTLEDSGLKPVNDVNNFANISRNSNYLDFGNDYADELAGSYEYEKENLKKEKYPNTKKNHWTIPSERKEAAEEIIEEDRQYLEDINS
jgi:hypothetical protein